MTAILLTGPLNLNSSEKKDSPFKTDNNHFGQRSDLWLYKYSQKMTIQCVRVFFLLFFFFFFFLFNIFFFFFSFKDTCTTIQSDLIW